jgi:hypothetical protein
MSPMTPPPERHSAARVAIHALGDQGVEDPRETLQRLMLLAVRQNQRATRRPCNAPCSFAR